MRALTLTFLVACGTSEPAAPVAPPEASQPAPQTGPQAAYAALGIESTWGPETTWTSHDADFQGAVSLSAVLNNPATHAGPVVIEGRIADVCQKKGCWTVLSDGTRTLRVTMQDHAFGLPMDASGATAQLKGELIQKAVDPKTVAHYASESAKPDAMPEKAIPEGETQTWELVASSARLKR